MPYPHTRYSQIAVPDFIFGGMENTTRDDADRARAARRARGARPRRRRRSCRTSWRTSGGAICVTCREWSEAWLNEGFATYFEYVWREHAKGRDEADYELLADTEGYLTEAGRYQRPVVCRQYDEPIHLFDAHLYEKGGRVLHMLRNELGDGLFWRALGHYVEQARARVGRDARSRARDRGGLGPQRRRVLRPLDRAPRAPRARGRAGSGTTTARSARCALAQKQTVSAEAPLFEFDDPRALRGRRPGARRAGHRRRRDARLRVSRCRRAPTQVIFDPGDVRAQVDEDGEAARAVAPAARGGAPRASTA